MTSDFDSMKALASYKMVQGNFSNQDTDGTSKITLKKTP